eukprot:521406_1
MSYSFSIADIGYVFGWILALCCVPLFIFQITKYVVRYKNNKFTEDNIHLKRNHTILFGLTFGTILFSFIYGLLYGLIGPLNIIMTHKFCQLDLKYIINIPWILSRYCFYNFILWRTKTLFRNPYSLKLAKCTFYVYQILIHLWCIFAIIITIFYTTYTFNHNHCDVLMNATYNGYIYGILWLLDALLIIGLFYLFLKRLFQMKDSNSWHINTRNLIRKIKCQVITSCIFTGLTSIVMAFCICFMKTKIILYFIPLDSIIKLLCLVFSFYYCKNKICKKYMFSKCLCIPNRFIYVTISEAEIGGSTLDMPKCTISEGQTAQECTNIYNQSTTKNVSITSIGNQSIKAKYNKRIELAIIPTITFDDFLPLKEQVADSHPKIASMQNAEDNIDAVNFIVE